VADSPTIGVLGERALELYKRGADPDALLDAFLTWASERNLSLYPAQEEAILELFAGKHVVLATPTGSGKSLVATALMFGQLATGGRGYYTFPIKALVSEKFFELCDVLGPDNVGMMTGDATINRDAPVICCTAEILSNLALGEGAAANVDAVVMDEFHFYSDPDRGIAWQVPLITLPKAQFLLMSATLGDMSAINDSIKRITGAEVSMVTSDQRPVPLEFIYQETPLTLTIEKLIENAKAPIYIVSFSQREAVELAQALTSLSVVSKEQRKVIAEALVGFRFDTPFGKDLKRCLLQGIGMHHAGLLPKYRRLVERLTQQGKLAVICGTDTLGVGINVPIRTVLFTKLCKYDGEGTRRLSVREMKQIAGRAGRRGYDTQGHVVAQAPEHVIENKVLAAKAEAGKKKKAVFKKPPDRGYAHWDEQTFEKLASGTPEALESRFKVDHGMLLSLLERPSDVQPRGYRALIKLIADSHEREHVRRKLRARGKELFMALRNADIVHVRRTASGRGSEVVINDDLQRDFSMHHSLSLYLVEALEMLDPSTPSYALDALSFVEAILENPGVVLDAQQRKLRDALFHKLKAEGVEHDQRIAELEKVTYPKPNAELIYETFNAYASKHPWVKDGGRGSDAAIRPKSVMRDMHEQFLSFNEYVREYGIARAEGVLLRYLTDAYKTLVQTVPERYWNDELVDVAAFMRSTLERVDASLLAEWESMRSGEAASAAPEDSPEAGAEKARALLRDPRMLRARIRSELHMLVKALSFRDYEDAAVCVSHGAAEDAEPWTPDRFEAALAPFFAEHERLVFDHAARNAQLTLLDEQEKGLWRVRQVLVDPEEANDWYLECRVDLRDGREPEGPLIELVEIGH
jgi:superfamily II RNA helicase